MAPRIKKLRERREQLSVQNDFLRWNLSLQCQQLRPVTVWIEQGYNLAQHLAQRRPASPDQPNSRRSWYEAAMELLAKLLGNPPK